MMYLKTCISDLLGFCRYGFSFFAAAAGLVLVFSASPAQGQLRDRASLIHEEFAKASGLSARQTDVTVSERFYLDPDGAKLLTATLQYRETRLEFDPVGGGAAAERTLKMLAPTFTYLHILNDTYTLVVQARPGFFGDFQGDFGRHFRLEGGAFLSRPFNDKLTLGLGVAQGSNFGRLITVPVLQVLYFPTEKIMVDALLPVRGEVLYLFSKALEAGVAFMINGSQYMVNSRENFSADTVQFANISLGAVGRYQVMGQLYVTGEVGTTVSRRFDLRREDRLLAEFEPDNAAYARFGFQYRF